MSDVLDVDEGWESRSQGSRGADTLDFEDRYRLDFGPLVVEFVLRELVKERLVIIKEVENASRCFAVKNGLTH